jgi:diphthine synthase
MALYFIGLGLGNVQDITARGLDLIERADHVFLESYTSAMQSTVAELASYLGKSVDVADRVLVEQTDEIVEKARDKNVAFLVVGDPFGATTHIELRMRAMKAGITTEIVHNASILNAVGEIGLELYKYGQVTSIPFENKEVQSPYEVFKMNHRNNLHTLALLDLDPGRKRYMTIADGIEFLFSRGMKKMQLMVGCAGIGHEPEIMAGKAADVMEHKFTKKPQCIIIPAKKLHFVEEEALGMWR